MWTEALSGKKKLRIEKYADTCGLGLKLHETLTRALISYCLKGELANYDIKKSSSDNFAKFPRTVPFVRRRKRTVFEVEYLGDVLTKSCKTLDYDYLDYYLLF